MKLYTYNQKLAESVWWNLLWMTLGSLLMTICIQSVAAPHDFLAGGVMGVALLVAYWTGTLTPLLWYMLIDQGDFMRAAHGRASPRSPFSPGSHCSQRERRRGPSPSQR